MGSNPIGKCLRTTAAMAASEGEGAHKRMINESKARARKTTRFARLKVDCSLSNAASTFGRNMPLALFTRKGIVLFSWELENRDGINKSMNVNKMLMNCGRILNSVKSILRFPPIASDGH
jgi:hypothetical protein